MCHGSIDPKFLMRDAEDRFRAVVTDPVGGTIPKGEIPHELMGGLRGVWARLKVDIIRRAASAS